MSAETGRLGRLLALVPYLQAHPGTSITEASADFGITADQLRRDLQLLWMCGLPGHGPGDLIDLSFQGDSVSVVFDAGISRPQRLTGDEAFALIIALRALGETTDADHDAITRALAKVEAASGANAQQAGTETVAVAADPLLSTRRLMDAALREGKALRLRYYTATRDEFTSRIVDPLRVFEVSGRTYLEAWCRGAEATRTFRLDRVETVEVLDVPAQPPPETELRDLSAGFFAPSAEHVIVELRVDESYDWVSDYYVGVEAGPVVDGARRVIVQVADPAWVRRLVLGAKGAVSVISPLWLAESITAQARDALRAYPAKSGK